MWYLREPSRIVRKARWSAMRSSGRSRELTADTWNGRLTFHSGDGLIGKFLYVRRAYEKRYIAGVIAYLDERGLRDRRRDVVLDVGANIGMIAIALVKHGWYRRAIAFEPEPENFRLLTHNVRQNGFEHVIACRQLALSDRAGRMELELNEGNSGGHFLRSTGRNEAAVVTARSSTRVETVTCDDVLAGESADLIDRVGLVWLDIEGHEGHFFRGARRLLDRRIPVVSEFYPAVIARSRTSPEEYLDLVRGLFTHVCIETDGRFAEHPIKAVERLFTLYPKDGTNVIYLRR
jgi:FkbM family methyltransferase